MTIFARIYKKYKEAGGVAEEETCKMFWNEGIASAAQIAILDFGEDDVSRAIEELHAP